MPTKLHIRPSPTAISPRRSVALPSRAAITRPSTQTAKISGAPASRTSASDTGSVSTSSTNPTAPPKAEAMAMAAMARAIQPVRASA